tara:strand:+ start:207 stop:389 length:183 start_codon:yes stop_codon:yes gene_type:complete
MIEKTAIINYLSKRLSKSLLGSYVNGSPEQRKFALMRMAEGLFYRLTEKEKENILKKINK